MSRQFDKSPEKTEMTLPKRPQNFIVVEIFMRLSLFFKHFYQNY